MPALPFLNESRCTSCGDCVPICPTDCLEMSDGLPWLPRPKDCLSCAICAVICPVDAICLELEEDASRDRQEVGGRGS